MGMDDVRGETHQPASTSSTWDPVRIGAGWLRSIRKTRLAMRRRLAPGVRARIAEEREAQWARDAREAAAAAEAAAQADAAAHADAVEAHADAVAARAAALEMVVAAAAEIGAGMATARRETEAASDARSARARRVRLIAARRRRAELDWSAGRAIAQTRAIFNGEVDIAPDDIGERIPENACPHCRALRWEGEKTRTMLCCLGGKVNMRPHPLGAEGTAQRKIHDLWTSPCIKGRVLRKFARPINNALALASSKFDKRNAADLPGSSGWVPCVVIMGRLYHNLAALRPAQGMRPSFAQAYVIDAQYDEEEHDVRVANCILPNATNREVAVARVLLRELPPLLRECNPYVQDFVSLSQMGEVPKGKLVINAEARPVGAHERQYNRPEGLKEVCVVIDDDSGRAVGRDCVVQTREGEIKSIDQKNRAFDPLHYTTLFPEGEDGWDLSLTDARNKKLTTRAFYAYHLNEREGDDQRRSLFAAKRLFQEYMCMAYVKTETRRLEFLKFNQDKIRADLYHNLADHMSAADANPEDIGVTRTILPSSFAGSPRDMMHKYQDAMAIVRENGKPDLFVTMTCNPTWPEITAALPEYCKHEDRPDITARVFKLKLDALVKEILEDGIFGEIAAHIHVVEFQKRGLPHAHLLIILKRKILGVDDVDKFVCAEVPTDNPKLREVVLKNMIHTPCGRSNRGFSTTEPTCLKDGCCSKGFPKEFAATTEWNDDDTHPTYRRRSPAAGGYSGVDRMGRTVDNRWVVPYNPYLALKYEAHINVEVCSSTRACKYLFKYIHKGGDRASVRVETGAVGRDEIGEFQDCRCIGASEAAWRLFGFDMSFRTPDVKALPVHEENAQTVQFTAENAQVVVDRPPVTQLMAWFDLNQAWAEAEVPNAPTPPPPMYHNVPATYIFEKGRWRPKKRRLGKTIGRIHWVHPSAGERYYLRMLLAREDSRGKTSFAALRKVDDVEHDTYKEACEALGILANDGEWDDALTHAAAEQMPRSFRKLFVYILQECEPTCVDDLFDKHWEGMADDFKRDVERRGVHSDAEQVKTVARAMCLLELENLLRSNNQVKTLTGVGLPGLTRHERAVAEAEFVALGLARRPAGVYDAAVEQEKARAMRDTMLDSQRAVIDPVVAAVSGGNVQPCLAFWDAPAGTGKTYCANALLSAVRGMDKVAISVASSGIAAVLLDGGRTFHSAFKAPLSMTRHSNGFNVARGSDLAKLIEAASLILWDEAPMMNRHYLDGLDEMLRDITRRDVPMGGKSVVIAGDFRQCLPVVVRGGRGQVVCASIKKSPLWPKFQVLRLTVNMRVRRLGESPEAERFAQWLMAIGDGKNWVGTDTDMHNLIDIPDELRSESVAKMIDWAWPDLKNGDVSGVLDSAILAGRNSVTHDVNADVLKLFPGEEIVSHSADTLMGEDAGGSVIPVEYLNKEVPNGMPLHELRLKEGVPVMLLRNLDPNAKLCNGTRMTVKRQVGNVLIAEHEVDDGPRGPELREVMIPRIPLSPKDTDYPFKWQRRQFPVRVAFAMTINKSQGQTFRGKVGVLLNDPVFGHGQFYVAASRTVHPDNIRFCVSHEPPEVHGKLERYSNPLTAVEEEADPVLRHHMDPGDEAELEDELLGMLGGEVRDDPDLDDFGPDVDEEAMMRDMETEGDEERPPRRQEPPTHRDVLDADEEAMMQAFQDEEGPDEDEEAMMRGMEDEPPAPSAPTAEDVADSMTAPLTPGQEAAVDAALAPGPPSDVLASGTFARHGDLSFTRKDAWTTKPGEWLNDEMVNFTVGAMAAREARRVESHGEASGRPRTHFMSTFFTKKLCGEDGRSYDYDAVHRWTTQTRLGYDALMCDTIVVPVHQGIHWVLATVELREKRVRLYDSLNGEDHHLLDCLKRWVRDEYKYKKGEVVDTSGWAAEHPEAIPRQMNGCDCGVFMLKYADYIASGCPLTFTQADMGYFRRRIVADGLEVGHEADAEVVVVPVGRRCARHEEPPPRRQELPSTRVDAPPAPPTPPRVLTRNIVYLEALG